MLSASRLKAWVVPTTCRSTLRAWVSPRLTSERMTRTRGSSAASASATAAVVSVDASSRTRTWPRSADGSRSRAASAEDTASGSREPWFQQVTNTERPATGVGDGPSSRRRASAAAARAGAATARWRAAAWAERARSTWRTSAWAASTWRCSRWSSSPTAITPPWVSRRPAQASCSRRPRVSRISDSSSATSCSWRGTWRARPRAPRRRAAAPGSSGSHGLDVVSHRGPRSGGRARSCRPAAWERPGRAGCGRRRG